MEGLIKEGVGDLAGFATGHITSAFAGGDAHFFEDIPSSPAKIKELLESNQVIPTRLLYDICRSHFSGLISGVGKAEGHEVAAGYVVEGEHSG